MEQVFNELVMLWFDVRYHFLRFNLKHGGNEKFWQNLLFPIKSFYARNSEIHLDMSSQVMTIKGEKFALGFFSTLAETTEEGRTLKIVRRSASAYSDDPGKIVYFMEHSDVIYRPYFPKGHSKHGSGVLNAFCGECDAILDAAFVNDVNVYQVDQTKLVNQKYCHNCGVKARW